MIRKYFRNTYFLKICLIPFYVFYCIENLHCDNNISAMQISKMYTISLYEEVTIDFLKMKRLFYLI